MTLSTNVHGCDQLPRICLGIEALYVSKIVTVLHLASKSVQEIATSDECGLRQSLRHDHVCDGRPHVRLHQPTLESIETLPQLIFLGLKSAILSFQLIQSAQQWCLLPEHTGNCMLG
jgi:hypothetical protein